MEQQIWLKKEEKWAYILVLRGHEVYRLKVTGSAFNLKGRIQAVLDALEGGTPPAEAGAKSMEMIDARTIEKASIDPGNDGLTLKAEGEDGKELTYSSAGKDAGDILQAILAQSGKSFEPTQEEIGVVEAVLPPVFVGGIAGFFWWLVYESARKLAAGEAVQAKGRRKGMQQMLIWAADALGVNGTIGVGVLLLVLVLGWMALRIVKRPERTVYRPVAA